MLAIARALRKMHFDLSICMNFAIRGAVVAWLAGIPHRLGYDAQHAGIFFNHVASSKREGIKHEALNHLEVLKPFGLFTNNTSLTFRLPETANVSLARKKAEWSIPEQGYVVLCPFGSYARKNLPTEIAVGLVKEIRQKSSAASILEGAGKAVPDAWQGREVYLIGGPKESAGLKEIAYGAGLTMDHVLAGTLNLQELAVFLSTAACLVTVDTGPQHIAQAAHCPTVALFGPTDPVVWGPRGEHDVVLYNKPACSPCWGKGECPEEPGCMGKLDAAEIVKAVRWLTQSIAR